MHFRFKKKILKSLLICTFYTTITSANFNPALGSYIFENHINSNHNKIDKKLKLSNTSLNYLNQIIKKYDISKENSIKKDNTIFLNRKGFVKIDGPKISVSFKDIPAKDALQAVAKLGGYGYVYIPNVKKENQTKNLIKKNPRLINLNFTDEDYETVFNSILIASGLQGKKEQNIIFVGDDVLSKGFNPETSRIYKMKNASASSGADYLASLGAVINKVSLTSIGGPKNKSVEKSFNTDYSVKSYGANQGPLKGLTGTSDSRLETLTLIGKIDLLDLAEKYLDQIDKDLKQVAMSVKILDVNLNNGDELNNSLILKTNNPPAYIDNNSRGFLLGIGNLSQSKSFTNPDFPATDFVNTLLLKITSNDTKVLASPTLILSESKDDISSGQEIGGTDSELSTSSIGRPKGNESFVTVGTKVITKYNVIQNEGSPPSCEAIFGTAGLTFGARVLKVSSDGYVSFSLSPELSSISSTLDTGTCGVVNVLSVRRLDTGTIRVKDGDTFALTGVVSDTETEVKTKTPILGDIPLLGNLFKNKQKTNNKSELIILVTPNIIDDKYKINSDNFEQLLLSK